jgi:hypothetical protein
VAWHQMHAPDCHCRTLVLASALLQRCAHNIQALRSGFGNLYCTRASMMRARTSNRIRTAIAVALMAAAPAAQSTMYRWVDQNGAITYSDQPPTNQSTVRQLTAIDRAPRMTEHEKRTLEIVGAEREKPGSDSMTQTREAGASAGAAGTLESARELTRREAHNPPRSPDGEPSASSRFSNRPIQAEAVRDPCLRSADPRCHEKNRAAYVPYLGYSPSAARARSELGLGATSGASGAGAVGASVGAGSPVTASAPARRTSIWQLRQSMKDAKDLK